MRRPPLRLPLAPEGLPFILPAAALGFLLLVPGGGWAIAGGAALALAILFAVFFRDPTRMVPAEPGLVVSPADGRVMRAGPVEPSDEAPEGLVQVVTIFLGLMNVHVNRSPVSGRIERVSYRRGGFVPAYREEASRGNERNEVVVAGADGVVAFRQVAGVVARRIVFRRSPGDRVERGERVGLIRFGSRVDVFLPAGFAPRVGPGQRVRGGESVLAVAGRP